MSHSAAFSDALPPTSQAGPQQDTPSTLGGLAVTLVSRGSPQILIALLLGFGSWRLALGGWSWHDPLVVAGLLAWWPFQEWLIHTYLLHWRPRQLGPFTIDFAQARKHRRHHLAPWDFREISIPLHTYTYAVPILLALAYFGQSAPVVLTGITAYVALGLHYEWCHFMAHSNYVPKTRFYKRAWRNHRLHHFKNETLWMGVSSDLGDQALGTAPDPKGVAKSATCRTLGIEQA